MRQDHPLFNEPLSVDLTFESRPTPQNYRTYPEGAALGEEISVWPVQTASYSEPWIDPGIVSTPYGFEDSPDCEIISGGLNSKGPDSVAIGRQANLLLWGFFAPPPLMTDEAKRVFINAVHYIDRFDGQRPLVRAVAQSRDWALVYGGYLREMGTEALPWLERMVPADVLANVGDDADAYQAFIRENLEYINWNLAEPDPASARIRAFAIDEDLRSRSWSNRSIETLEACIALLDGPDDALGRRLLARYTDMTFETAAAWRTWLADNRERLFFSDVGGYKWFVAPTARSHDAENLP